MYRAKIAHLKDKVNALKNHNITMNYDPSIIPADENMMPLIAKNLKDTASDEEKILFKTLWQGSVKKILLAKDQWDKLITLH